MRLVLASANPHKVAEVAAILGDAVVLEPRPSDVPEVVEDADTLLGNARLKAAAIAAATGAPAVADDTGLEVEALDGRPGVYSARFAGSDATYADNVAKLLQDRLRGQPVTLVVGGYGEQDPVADNSTPEGQMLNRRVMVLYKPAG